MQLSDFIGFIHKEYKSNLYYIKSSVTAEPVIFTYVNNNNEFIAVLEGNKNELVRQYSPYCNLNVVMNKGLLTDVKKTIYVRKKDIERVLYGKRAK